jgi:carbon-monoxide dehydrogenase large subunit
MTANRTGVNKPWVGRPIKRREDPRLITGRGRFIEDFRIPDLADVVLVRSIHAHARIVSIASDAARAMPGVIAVVTAADLTGVGGVPVTGDLKIPPHPPLSHEIVRFVGDPIVAIVAENRALAADALERVVIDYEPLPAVVNAADAANDLILVHAELGTNIALTAKIESGDVDAELAAADHRLPIHAGHGRIAALPIETRGGIASYDPLAEQFTLWLSTQAAWGERADLAVALGVGEERIRVITPDVGGAFGAKMTVYRETILLLALAKLVGRPVRYLASRSEDLQSSTSGRDSITDGEVAFDRDGTIRALRIKTVANFGAYLMKHTGIPPMRMLFLPTGAYPIRHLRSEIAGVFTNTGPTGPYRGAGRPEAAFVIERAVSDIAHALGMDQAEIRRRNFIQPDAFPYRNAGGWVYDSGNYEAALDRALAAIDYDARKREVAARRARGKLVGIGIASCVEVSGAGWESAQVTVGPDGTVRAFTGSSPHGSGLEGAFAQIVADQLAIPPGSIAIRWGDTDGGPPGVGTMGSRSTQIGGNAIHQAAIEVRNLLLETAAELLEAAVADLELEHGAVRPRDLPGRALPFSAIVQAYLAKEGGEGITATVRFQPTAESSPFGTTIAVVAIDPETGEPSIERYVSVVDVGNVINPLLVEGQLAGGIVQGMGEALWEQVVYDRSGQLLSGTLTDYSAPRAHWLPEFELSRTVTPSPHNPLGVKGAGEAGAVHAPAAIANAIADALRPFGVQSLDLPLTAEKIWSVIHGRDAGPRDRPAEDA